MKKSLLEMVEEASRRPVPYKGLPAIEERREISGESQELPTTDENPRHQEDFSRLLGAAARGRKPDDQT